MEKLNELCKYTETETFIKVEKTPFEVVNMENKVALVVGKAIIDEDKDFKALCKKWDDEKYTYLVVAALSILVQQQEMEKGLREEQKVEEEGKGNTND